jgi:type I restriction enzyme S subunit
MVTATQKITIGYKQTEVGVIPADWDVKKLDDIVEFSNGKAHEKFINDNGDYIVVNSKFISTEGRVFKTSSEDFSPLSAGDITMVMSDIPNGRALAKCFLIKESERYTLNQRICSLKPVNSDGLYLFYKLNRNKYFTDFDSGVGQTNLKRREVLDCPVALPSNKVEQTVIATVLSDTDILIEKLEKLIEKKINIKQGVMQGLLTGKRRLPGFSGKWESKKLGELLDYEQPTKYLVKDTEYSDSYNTPVLTAGKTFILGYTNEETGIFRKLPVIIFDDFTTAIKFVDFPFKAKSSAMKMLKPRNDGANLRFIFEKMQLIDFMLGDHKRYWISEYQNIEIGMPKPEEQTVIASVLSDMDDEIEELESKLNKYQNIKQGMMQTLLTGKIRLPIK